ncbi:MAG TPA: extracellular solute-binding protein [Spirochaetia bacterium]|nr:extracellular solute-binding protein [Spirochaetia bacterium]
MKNTSRLAIVFSIVLLILPALVFAGGQSEAAKGQVTLKVLWGQSTTDAGSEKLIDAALAAKYPNIKISWDIGDWGKTFQPKMQQYMQTGLPDIMIGKGQDVATWGPQGVLADLKGKPYLNNLLPAAVQAGTLNGKVYGVVFNALYQGVYYNRKLFKDNNVSVPTTQAELKQVIEKFKSLGITPFASHYVDTWSIGNQTMQFAINGVFNTTPNWGDQFRAGKVSFATSPEWRAIFGYNKLIYDNTWTNETFSLEETQCDARLVQGKAAMDVSGSWSIQNFLAVDPNFDFGIFPFPNETGNAKLIFEPNITMMVSAKTKYPDAVDKVISLITGDKALALEIYNRTKTASMLKDVSPTYTNPSQKDIDYYASKGMIVDAGTGNNQLVWGGFQDENAKDIAAWLQGQETLDQALKAADSRRANSKP